MQKVITINLSGNAYQLDESAYDALRAYLNAAEIQLKGSPDWAEIIGDFEHAIAEKCRKFLRPGKTVVVAAEMDQILREMGPVEGAEAAESGANAGPRPAGQPYASVPPRKRLYRIREGQKVAGVCNGLAAYFNIDVTLVRIGFLLFMWTGIGWLAYIALMVVVPYADTSDEHAAARGVRPFNAREVIEQAKRTAADITGTVGATGKEWQRQWRESWRDRRAAGAPLPSLGGFLVAVVSILSIALMTFLIGILVRTVGHVGWSVGAGLPSWGIILALVVAFQIATAPIRMARHASYDPWGRSYGWLAIWDGLVATGVTMLLAWLLYTRMPATHDLQEFVQNLPDAIRSLGRDARAWLQNFP